MLEMDVYNVVCVSFLLSSKMLRNIILFYICMQQQNNMHFFQSASRCVTDVFLCFELFITGTRILRFIRCQCYYSIKQEA